MPLRSSRNIQAAWPKPPAFSPGVACLYLTDPTGVLLAHCGQTDCGITNASRKTTLFRQFNASKKQIAEAKYKLIIAYGHKFISVYR